MNTLVQQFTEQQLAGFICVLARVTPLFLVAPLFSSRMVPRRVRVICAVGLTVGIAPVVTRGQRVPLDLLPLIGTITKEILVGLAFAFVIAALFAAVSAAGSILDTMIGFSFGSLLDPITGNQGTVLQQLYSMVGVIIFIVIGGDAWVIMGLAKTFELVPLTATPQLDSVVGGMLQAFSTIFVAALEVAAPVLLALVITDAAFGVVSRVVPQLNVFAVGFPAKILIGLAFIGISLPFAGGWIADQLEQSVSAGLQTLRLAVPAP